MTNFKSKTSALVVKVFTYICTITTASLLLISATSPVQAAYNSGAQRYEDSLNNPHQQAVYTYNYENTAPDAAPGYFEIPIENIGAGAGTADQYVEVTSITDTFPVDPVTYVPTGTAQTITTDPTKAAYVSAGILKVRVSPQTACVMQTGGGCTMNNIPAAVPGKLTIKLSIKTSSPTTPTLLDGSGKIYFPNGYDINAIGWRVNVAYVKTNDVLDPSVAPAAAIKGQGGTGTAILNQPYTVVTSGIKAVDGNPLNAPNGTCKSTVGGTVYTGNGITNGVCTINIPTNAPQTIPGGTVDLNDGGTPRPITLNGIPYQSVQAGQPSSPLTTADIPGLTVACTAATANSTTTCTFDLPANKTLPADFKLGVGDANPAGTCTVGSNSVTVTCTNIPTGSQTGLQPINGQIGTGPKTDTGEKVQISPKPSNTTPITQSDLTNLGFNCGINNSVPINSTAVCTGTLPAGKSLDPANALKLTIGSNTALSDTCTSSGQTIVCNNVPTGSTAGVLPLKAQLGSGALTNTGQNVTVVANPLTQEDIPNLNTLAKITCNPDPAPIGSTTTCTGTLPANKTAPTESLKLNIEGQAPVTCTFSGQTFTCSNMPAGNVPGTKNVQGAIGNKIPQNTGKTIVVSNKTITEADIPNIGTGTDADPFKNLNCGNSDTVNAGAPTTCTGTLKDGWSIPSGFKLGIGVDPAGTCSQAGQVVTCLSVPVTSRAGAYTIVKAQIGAGSIIDTGKRVTVQAVAVVLARTGGAALIGVGLALILGLGAFVAFTRHNKINAKNLNLDNQATK